MKIIKIVTAFAVLITVLNCSKITDKFSEKVEEKVNEKVNEELKKTTEDELNKDKKVNESLDDEKILKDPNGQWAIDAEASSSYSPAAGKNHSWSAEQMLGEPNVQKYGDNGSGWASKEQDKDIEWVKLKFEKAVYASEVRVRQNYNPGAIIKIELIDEYGKSYVVWSGTDKTKYRANSIEYFTAKFDKTKYKSKTVKITLSSKTVPGWNEIDAVQLVGE